MTALVLVGLMGSGKTTVGRLVAERTGRALIDSDDAIEARTGRTVRELWEQGGEAAYRRLESEVVLEALASSAPVVVAAPGGVVLDPAARAGLAAAFVVWLRADPAVLAGRVAHGDHRPLIGDRPRAVLAAMVADRAALYEEVADEVVDVDQLSPETVATTVIEMFHRADVGA